MDNREKELAEKLQWIADYNQGKREKPNFPESELIEIRMYQMELAKERMKEIEKVNWEK